MKALLLVLIYSTLSFGQELGVAPEWQLELYTRGNAHMICKATMLSPQWAITAAHCTSYPFTEQPLSSRDIGLKDKYGTQYNVVSKGVFNYQHYNSSALTSDFSLLKITAYNGQSRVTTFPKIAKSFTGKKAQTTKWVPNDKLKKYHYRFPAPVKKYGSLYTVKSPYSLCQLNDNGSHSGSNSGSPLFTSDKKGQPLLIGLHSKSSLCEENGLYIFTNVVQFRSWIHLLMEHSS